MGYHSDVGVCLTFKNQEDFKTFAAKALLEGVKPEIFDLFHRVDTPLEDTKVVILLLEYGTKWYRNDPDFKGVAGVDALWCMASDEVYEEPAPLVESGRYITIGEDGHIEDDEIVGEGDAYCFACDYLEYTTPQLQTAKPCESTARELISKE